MSSVYIEIGGIHPTPCRPKPLPTTPHNSDVMIKLLSQKEEVWSESLCPFKKVKVLSPFQIYTADFGPTLP